MQSKLSVSLLCAASVTVLSTGAWAQDAAAPAETVVVTGSRVISDVANSPTPITAVSTASLLATSPTTISDALNKLPIFQGSATPSDANNSSHAVIGNVLNLRYFGAQRTLVLLDGHRQAPSNADGTVDIDTLPEMLMQRVDIVTGGASAVYGSDAVTGVVNFILDKHFTGFKVDANAGISNFADGAEQKVGIAAGADLFGGRGHIEGSLTYYNLDPIYLATRPWGPQSAWLATGTGSKASPYTNTNHLFQTQFAYGGKITCTGCAANGEQFVGNGVIGPFNLGTPTAISTLAQNSDGVQNQSTTSQASQRTYQNFERFSYNIDDTTTAYIQTIAAQSFNLGNHVNNYFQTGTFPNQYYANNPFLTPANQALLASPSGKFTSAQYLLWPNYPGFLVENLNRNLSATVGVDGTLFGKYDWDVFFTHGENRLENYDTYNQSNAKTLAGQDAVVNPANGQIVCQVSLTQYASLYPGCVPLNPFGPTSLTTSQFNYMTTRTTSVLTQRLDDVGASVSGDVFELPAGAVKAALDGEYRRLSYGVKSNVLPGTVDCTGLRLCVSNIPNYTGATTIGAATVSESVYEFAGEVNVPLLKDLPLIQSASLDLAGRYTSYSISGAVETWKIGFDYHVDDQIHVRATTSVDIRAPTLNDLYAPQSLSHTGFADIHTGNGLQQVTQISQGNANLAPEVARTYTAGAVFTPNFIPGLVVSADYYQITLKNAISNVNGTTTGIQQLCEASGGTSPFCTLFVRPLPYANTTPANYPTAILSETLNAAFNSTSGVDVEADYSFQLADVLDSAPGSIDLRMLGDYQPFIDVASFPGAPVTVTAIPKGRITSYATYNLGNWTFNLRDRFLTKFLKSPQPGVVFFSEPYGKALNYIDLTIDRKFDVDGNVLDGYLNIQNLINTKPPIEPLSTTGTPGGSAYGAAGGASVQGVDDVGRYFTIGIRARF